MAPVAEGKRKAEYLISEAFDPYRSREEVVVTVPANTTIPAGRIMAVIAATGKYVPHDEDGTDNGTRAPRAILFDNVTNDTGAPVDVSVTVSIRDCVVRAESLTHDPARNEAGRTNDLEDLEAFGIIARTET